MKPYTVPQSKIVEPVSAGEVLLIANGDLRESANKVCWPAQEALERKLTGAFAAEGYKLRRAHPFVPEKGHGFISGQRMGMDVFTNIHPDAPLVIAEAVWQYSQHVLPGLIFHRGPVLTVANWSGQWPGLVGMLNLNGCLKKAGVPYSTLWSENFEDDFFRAGLREWLSRWRVDHDESHVHSLELAKLPKEEVVLGQTLARHLQAQKAIMGVFDEGCMGMYNAIVEDAVMSSTGVFKERLSQSALVAAMRDVTEPEAQQIRNWMDAAGVTFKTGPNESTDLTDAQILEQCKMYIAAARIADEYGCDAIGIQYQQGLKDMVPASDLVEGLLNNKERPPVFSKSGKELFAGQPLPHFNEVDECAGLDAIVTNRVWTAMGWDPATTLHDVRWGEHYTGEGIDDFVWLFQISGASPASHFIGGYEGAVSERQPPMYFRLGGGTLKGICKPGAIVWSRIFVADGKLKADMGVATVVELPQQETERRWASVTSQWPIMHVVLDGVSRDQFMGRHAANHVNVAYAPGREEAISALAAKASMMHELGVEVHLCGEQDAVR